MRGHRTARVGSLIEHAPVTTRPEVHLSGGNLFTLTVIRWPASPHSPGCFGG
jgi:hypothetical protein